MAGSVNKVILIGNLGKDPEIRVLENGTKLARFPIATSESYTDRTTNERKVITDWHNIVVWRGLADVIEKYVTKGQKIYIEGKLKTRSWQDESGATRYSTEVVADNMTMLSSRNENSANTPSNQPDFNTGNTPSKPKPMDSSVLSDDDDDDLPF
ncbi:single-stranded DNA-binding protein [Brumimicrobium aurantiacum]|uniref:Single-stranded DNA-binding protein n=1 Tax=Brumimicrobium aurantiacum TaxID=1737063 RepID=A0A3E1F0N6_9FLAO|nr:single-stranded DNA-binding protein [Brumimicrobium aurantiacum]RFC55376.1 single-stranded DNA-binding protein [Brumimicrobium aurantiacum]